MAAFESLSSLFETPSPDSPTLLESLSWNQIKPAKPPDDDAAAFTEIFGELHFEERTTPPTVVDAGDPTSLHASFSSGAVAALGDPDPSPSTSPWLPAVLDRTPALDRGGTDHENLRENGGDPSRGSSPGSSRSGAGDSFQIGHADSFQLCTEGLGFESSDDHVEDSSSESSGEHCCQMKETTVAVDRTPRSLPAVGYAGCRRVIWGRRPRTTTAEFPPPITCIGSSGKPCFRFSSHREGGRFVLREVRLPHRVLLHASRKDGRLRLQFVQPDEEIIEEEEEEEEEIIEEEEGESSEEGDDAEGDHAEE